jgi:hypothetical protein
MLQSYHLGFKEICFNSYLTLPLPDCTDANSFPSTALVDVKQIKD